MTIKNGPREAAADSQLDLLMLIVKKGDELEIIAEGPQAGEAIDAIIALFDAKFGEPRWTSLEAMGTYTFSI